MESRIVSAILPVVKRLALLMLLVLSSSGQTAAQSGPDWLTLDEGQTLVTANEKILFIFFEAEWCSICKRMKKKVFPNADVLVALNEGFVPVSIDLDSKLPISFNGEDYTERSFSQAMQVEATPTLVFTDDQGNILGGTSGYFDPERFLLLLDYVKTDAFMEMEFTDFEKVSKERSSTRGD